jgi:GNAT superfamily N-acetyltransferase
MSRVLTASITELCAADHRNEPARVARWTANKTEAGVAGMLANPEQTLFVAEDDGSVAAVGAINRAGEVTLNYVDPARRFRGVSRALLEAMEAELMARGVVDARLVSTGTARTFYRGAGWADAGDPQDHAGMACYPMTKRLGDG